MKRSERKEGGRRKARGRVKEESRREKKGRVNEAEDDEQDCGRSSKVGVPDATRVSPAI